MSQLLNRALVANALFSTATGIAAVSTSTVLAPWLGIATGLLIAIGLGLIGFGLLVEGVRRRSRMELVTGIVAADVTWVIGAAAILTLTPDVLSTAGQWTVAGLSVIVADIAAAQWVGVRRLVTP